MKSLRFLDNRVDVALLVLVVVRGEADGPVDLGLALLVGGGKADGAEDVVHLLETETLRLGDEEEDEEASDEGECLLPR